MRMLAITAHGLVALQPQASAGSLALDARILLADPQLRQAAVDPHTPEILYAASRGSGVARSDDGGRSWRRLRFGADDAFAIAAGPAEGSVYVGTEPSRLFLSRDRGASWEELTALQDIPSRPTWSFPPRPWTSHVRTIAPHPGDPDVILVGIELGGVMRTVDGGSSFEDHPRGAVADAHALAWHPSSPDAAYEAGGGGAARSNDGGSTWRRHDAGRELHYCWGLAVDPADPDRWYVSAAASAGRAHGRADAGAGVFRSEEGGGWQRLGGPDAGMASTLTSFPYALLASRDGLWIGLDDGSLFVSRDHGGTFMPVGVTDGRLLQGMRHLYRWNGTQDPRGGS